jgi:hypothetical protein
MVSGTYMLEVGDISEIWVQASEKMLDSLLALLNDSNTVKITLGWPALGSSAPNWGLVIKLIKVQRHAASLATDLMVAALFHLLHLGSTAEVKSKIYATII